MVYYCINIYAPTCLQVTENQDGLSSYGVRKSVPKPYRLIHGTHSPCIYSPAFLYRRTSCLKIVFVVTVMSITFCKGKNIIHDNKQNGLKKLSFWLHICTFLRFLVRKHFFHSSSSAKTVCFDKTFDFFLEIM